MTGRYFVILGTMRTGSNLLESLLSQLPDVEMFGELFNPAFIMRPNRREHLGWTLAERDADPIGFLERVRQSAPGRIPGFRLFDGHEARIIDHVLADPDCARIILRRDPVESFLSLRIAQETGQWILRNLRRRKRARIRFDAKEFESYSAAVAAHYRALDDRMIAFGTNAAAIDYDQLSELAEINGLAAHIGSAARLQGLAPEILRQNPEPLEAKVSNAPEMLAYLGKAPAAADRPGTSDLIGYRAGPLAWSPMPGQDRRLGLGVLNAVGAHAFGAEPIRFGQLIAQHKSFAETLQAEALAEAPPVFAVSEPPSDRLHALFVAQCFGGKQGLPFVIQELDRQTGAVDRWKDWKDKLGEPEVLARHRTRFLAFLEMIVAARAGLGQHPVHEGWEPQVAALDDARESHPTLQLVRCAELVDDCTRLADGLGAPGLPGRALAPLQKYLAGRSAVVDTVLTPQMAVKCADLDLALV